VKQLLLLLLGTVLTTGVYAGSDWKLYYENSSVKIYYSYTECHDVANGLHQEKVILKFENLTGQKQQITFSKLLKYSTGKETSTDVDYQLVLNPGQVLEGDCDNRDKALYIFSKMLENPQSILQKFDLKNIIVKPIE